MDWFVLESLDLYIVSNYVVTAMSTSVNDSSWPTPRRLGGRCIHLIFHDFYTTDWGNVVPVTMPCIGPPRLLKWDRKLPIPKVTENQLGSGAPEQLDVHIR